MTIQFTEATVMSLLGGIITRGGIRWVFYGFFMFAFSIWRFLPYLITTSIVSSFFSTFGHSFKFQISQRQPTILVFVLVIKPPKHALNFHFKFGVYFQVVHKYMH